MIGLLLTLIGGGGLLSTLTSLPLAGATAAFFSTRAGRFVAVLLGLVALYTFGHWRGEADASGQCQADALRAKLQAAEIDRQAANYRATSAQLVIKGLEQQAEASKAAIDWLQSEFETRPIQSTKPGAKVDANALLDDRCRYTPAGARRLRK